jgi:hypothetical protein
VFDSRAHAVDALGIDFMKGEVMQRFTLRELADHLRDLADGQADELGELLSQSAFALDAFASSQQEEETDSGAMLAHLGISITRAGSGFVVSWADSVANEWQESFSVFSDAVAFVALVVRCHELGGAVGFSGSWRVSVSRLFVDSIVDSQQQEEDRTMMFRVDGDGELLEGVVIEKFDSSPVVIDGISLAIDPTELPAFVVDCGERGSWLVPSTWEVK